MKRSTKGRTKMNTTIETTNLIEAAVSPLKAQAQDRAEEYAREVAAKVAEQLVAAGNDLQRVAPYPSGAQATRLVLRRTGPLSQIPRADDAALVALPLAP